MAGCLVDRWLTTHTRTQTDTHLGFRIGASLDCWEKLTFSTSHTSMDTQRYKVTINAFAHVPHTHAHTHMTFDFLRVFTEGSQFHTLQMLK